MTIVRRRIYVVVGLLLVGAIALSAQQSRSILQSWVNAKADISRMDWILLNARVENIREFSDGPMDTHTLTYDPVLDRIVGITVTSPKWLETATFANVKDSLQSIAIAHCVSVFRQNPATASWTAEDQFRHCYFELRTWDEQAKFKTVAVFENGEVKLR